MKEIRAFLETVKIARKQSHRNLTVFPLLAPGNGEPDYLTLQEAIGQGLVEVREAGRSGVVLELLLINRGRRKTLVVEGEELVGAKQDRTVNASFLIPGDTRINLPVSCVEHGRWSRRNSGFMTSDRVMHASLRGESQRFVSQNLAAGKGFRSDQRRIWNDIGGKARRLRSDAPTGAMADVYESARERMEGYLPDFHLVECQVGAIFAINGEIACMDFFGWADTFERFFQKLVGSHVLDAVDRTGEEGSRKGVPPDKARRFLESVTWCDFQSLPSIGVGKSLRLDSPSLSGAALAIEGKLLHLSAFKKPKGSESRMDLL
ncbi:MAG: DUF6569 family protein [Pseudomonadota bacterium]